MNSPSVLIIDDKSYWVNTLRSREMYFSGFASRVKGYCGPRDESHLPGVKHRRSEGDRPLLDAAQFTDEFKLDLRSAKWVVLDLVVENTTTEAAKLTVSSADHLIMLQSVRLAQSLLEINRELRIIFISSLVENAAANIEELLANCCGVTVESKRIGLLLRNDINIIRDERLANGFAKQTEIGRELLTTLRQEHGVTGDSMLQPERKDSEFPSWLLSQDAYRESNELLNKIALEHCNVTILGESGTGKEAFAKLLHKRSAFNEHTYRSFNIAALSDSLIESELFGHVMGAFTNAVRDRTGLLESASGGTLLIDEIGDLSPALQVKLLRVLEERCFIPVGGTVEKALDTRLLFATKCNLEEMVLKGLFRSDLYYRLGGVSVTLPPVRESKLAFQLFQRFLDECTERLQDRNGWEQGVLKASPGLMELICRSTWPGNIRELRSFAEQCCMLKVSEEQAIRRMTERIRVQESLQGK